MRRMSADLSLPRDLPGRINSPADVGAVDLLPTGPFALGTS